MKIKGIELMEMIFAKQLKEGQIVKTGKNITYTYEKGNLWYKDKLIITEAFSLKQIFEMDFELPDENISTLPDYKDLDDYDVSDIKMNRFKINEIVHKMNEINDALNKLENNYIYKAENCMTD